jgi:endonuclease YncB( thermonuclease family)
MNKYVRRFLFVSVLLLGCICHAKVLHGLVVAVADGDTITVLDESKQQHKIRLIEIDAPEKKEAYGQRSKLSLSELAHT